MRIYQQGEGVASVNLSKDQGDQIQKLIEKNINCRFSTYIHQVGLQPSNVYAILSGRRKCSIKVLDKLLSGTEYSVQCNLEFVIERIHGAPARSVPSQDIDEMLFLEDQDQFDVDHLIENVDQFTGTESQLEELDFSLPLDLSLSSFSSEKPQENTKIVSDSPFKEKEEES